MLIGILVTVAFLAMAGLAYGYLKPARVSVGRSVVQVLSPEHPVVRAEPVRIKSAQELLIERLVNEAGCPFTGSKVEVIKAGAYCIQLYLGQMHGMQTQIHLYAIDGNGWRLYGSDGKENSDKRPAVDPSGAFYKLIELRSIYLVNAREELDAIVTECLLLSSSGLARTELEKLLANHPVNHEDYWKRASN